jgi:murein DD-endopeptidase MepM/ murein hydrolase activator NlpD
VISEDGLPPFTLGIYRPVICLPAGIVNDPVTLESVIAHETAHVARLDVLWLRLQHLLQAVYFFHPLVWISGIKLNEERETLCDATVVAAGDLAARDYVGGLLNVLRLDLQGVGAPTMTARKRRIGVRIQRVLSRDGGRRPRAAVAAAAVAVLGVFLLPLSQKTATAMSDDVVESVQTSSPARTGKETEFTNPLPEGRVTWTWGPDKREPFTGKKVFHRGIDVAAKAGTEILAPADGIVTVATEDFKKSPSSGTVVIIDHGTGLTTTYSHLASFEVEKGQEVSRGDVIATVGSTGKSTGPHLHFEIWRDGESQDPARFIEEWKK